jgi:hypothetical protein
VTDTRRLVIDGLACEVDICTDPSTRDINVWVYAIYDGERDLVATGSPEELSFARGYDLPKDAKRGLQQAVADAVRTART